MRPSTDARRELSELIAVSCTTVSTWTAPAGAGVLVVRDCWRRMTIAKKTADTIIAPAVLAAKMMMWAVVKTVIQAPRRHAGNPSTTSACREGIFRRRQSSGPLHLELDDRKVREDQSYAVLGGNLTLRTWEKRRR